MVEKKSTSVIKNIIKTKCKYTSSNQQKFKNDVIEAVEGEKMGNVRDSWKNITWPILSRSTLCQIYKNMVKGHNIDLVIQLLKLQRK